MSTISKTHFNGEKGNHFVGVGHKTDQHQSLDSDYMDMTRSQTGVIESDNIKMGLHDPFRARKHLSSMVPPSEQSARGEIAFQLGAESVCSSKTPTSSGSDEMELTRSQTVAIESKWINMTFTSQTNAPLGNVAKVSISPANDMEVIRLVEPTHFRNNPVAVPTNLEEKEMIRDETQIFSEDHEIEITKAVTTQIEQHDAPTNDDMKDPSSTTKAISLCLPEGQLGEIPTNLREHFDLKGLADNEPDLKDEDRSIIPNKPESSPIASSVSKDDDNVPSKKAKTRRMSLDDLQLKL
ncbi:unnamed protein product [Coregonus sp. 'balchen']|nr:unnamed protein product [Coregonus sp. 'balchen']